MVVIGIQYLMLSDEQLTLTEAIHSVHRLFPTLPKKHQQFLTMEKRFQDYLKQLERKTYQRTALVSTISGDGSGNTSGSECPRSLRDLSS
ncbi:unnamed protein product, partial [Rotaria magnacalcarata]